MSLMRLGSGLAILLFFGIVSACNSSSPIKIGFLGGLSGKFSDLGTATRNGALLAIEKANDQGGINGRKLVLIEEDDKQINDQAIRGLENLSKQGVVAVVGPATSSIAMAVIPLANARKLVFVSPTSTTSKLTGLDDYFIRSIGDASFYGQAAAQYHFTKHGMRSVSIVLDMANADYTESWADSYMAEFRRLGGKVLTVERFTSTANPEHTTIAKTLVARNPQMVLSVASTVDSALIAQRVKELRPKIQMAGSGWASTERLIELGGNAVEGMYFEQYFDRFDPSEHFQGFLRDYRQRFKADPGFGAVLAFDAANLIIAGLKNTKTPDGLKSAIIGIGTFNGAQNPITLDQYGDVSRKVYFGLVRAGQFAKDE